MKLKMRNHTLLAELFI